MENTNTKRNIKYVLIAVLAVIALITFFGSFTQVSSQEIGVIKRFSAVNRIVGDGLHFKIPFIEDADKMSLAEQQAVFTTQAYSKDGQVIDLAVTVTYQVNSNDAEKIYREVKNDYQNIYLNPTVTPSSEEVITRYTAQELLDKKAEWSSAIKTLIVTRLQNRGITIKTIEVTKFDFDDAYERAIKDKQIAEQRALEQVNITAQEKEKKAQEILKAEALAEKTRLEAQALASQQGNKVIEKIEAEAALEAAKKWNGVLPTTMIPGGAVPFINVEAR